MNSKGQAAVEYLSVFGIALLISTPFVLKAQTSIMDLKGGSNAVAAESSLQDIKMAVETVSASGEPARRTFTVRVPDSVESGEITNNSIVYTLNARSGKSQMIRTFEANLTGTVPQDPGRHRLTVYMEDGEANLEVVN